MIDDAQSPSERTSSEVYPKITGRVELDKRVKQFPFRDGASIEVMPATSGSIHDGGEFCEMRDGRHPRGPPGHAGRDLRGHGESAMRDGAQTTTTAAPMKMASRRWADSASEIVAHHEGGCLHSPDRTIAMTPMRFPDTLNDVASPGGRSWHRTRQFGRKVATARVPA